MSTEVRIIKILDKALEDKDSKYFNLSQANKVLRLSGEFTIKEIHDQILKKALESKEIKNAYNTKTKPRQWIIFRSSSNLKDEIERYKENKRAPGIEREDQSNKKESTWTYKDIPGCLFWIVVLIVIILAVRQCIKSDSTDGNIIKSKQRDNQPEYNIKPIKQKSYTFYFSNMKAKYEGKVHWLNSDGRVVFLPKEIQVFKGREKGEIFYIKRIERKNQELIFHARNNLDDEAIFRLTEKYEKTYLNAVVVDAQMEFIISSGNYSELVLYNGLFKQEKQTKKKRESANTNINYCEKQKIKRSDGTVVTQFISLPIASNNTFETAVSISFNGADVFLSVALRFLKGGYDIKSNIYIQLEDNSAYYFKLTDSKLTIIDNNKMAFGIVHLDKNVIRKFKGSDLKNIELQLTNGYSYNMVCTDNKMIVKEQLNCLK